MSTFESGKDKSWLLMMTPRGISPDFFCWYLMKSCLTYILLWLPPGHKVIFWFQNHYLLMEKFYYLTAFYSHLVATLGGFTAVATYNVRPAPSLYLIHIILWPHSVLLDKIWYMGHLRWRNKQINNIFLFVSHKVRRRKYAQWKCSSGIWPWLFKSISSGSISIRETTIHWMDIYPVNNLTTF